MTTQPAIQFENISVAYDKNLAIHDVTLSVECGEFFGLMGLNGAGKTTLIKALLGLLKVQSGHMSVLGVPHQDHSAKTRMAFLPERFEPSWFLSGLEFLQFSARLYGKRLTVQECELQADLLALDPSVLKRRVQTYSKGMRQKLGLLATVMTGCDLLILDEPMSGLDPVARARVKAYLLKARSRGCTIFLSSHILADMEEICDRVAILEAKTIRFTGTPAECLAATRASNLEKAFLHFIEKGRAA